MSHHTILIVEDSPFVNNTLKDLFTKKGYECHQAFTLEEALAFLDSQQKCDYIILDMHLPDGYESELIIEIQRHSKAKIFILTTENDRQVREMMFRFGIVDYYIKDDSFKINVDAIDKLMRQLPHNKEHTILSVDDSQLIQRHISQTLTPHNYTIIPALTAEEAQEKLAQHHISLILLDMELPDLHGSKLLKLIKVKENYKDIPIIVLSGTISPEMVSELIKSGANDYIEKPFTHEAFILKVSRLIQEFERIKELENFNKELQHQIDLAVEKSKIEQVKMLQNSKLAQMGEMIGMIAHQWRQPLSAITAVTTNLLLKNELEALDPSYTDRSIRKIDSYVKHLSTTINDFRSFFKIHNHKEETNFKSLVDNALNMVLPLLKEHNINIDYQIDSDTLFYTYGNEVTQVVLNLLKNSYDAFVLNKTKEPKISLNIFVEDKNIIFKQCDNGGGIQIEDLTEIFQPYYTTKSQSDGTGLGLYMSHTIVKQHCKGEIHVSNIKDGSCFTITLPLDTKASSCVKQPMDA